jgi:hypothetical protein
MKVLVIGATAPTFRTLRALAARASPRLEVYDDRGPASPDWIVTATGDQRAEAIATYGLPPYRVLEVPALLSESEMARAEGTVRAGLAKMAGLGPARPLVSRAGVSVARLFLPWLQRAADRASHRLDADEFKGTDEVPWPPTATRWTEGPGAQLMAHVLERIPVGRELDEILAHHAMKRAKRFAAQTTPSGPAAVESGADRS